MAEPGGAALLKNSLLALKSLEVGCVSIRLQGVLWGQQIRDAFHPKSATIAAILYFHHFMHFPFCLDFQ